MLVRDVMRSPAVCVGVDDAPHAALQLMDARHLTCLPVLDAAGDLVGVLSEADLLRVDVARDPRADHRYREAGGQALPPAVADLMTPNPWTTTEDADAAEVARSLATSAWKSLPVLREGRVVGVVSRSDLVRALARPDLAIERDVNELLNTLGGSGWRATVRGGMVDVLGPVAVREQDLATSLATSVPGTRGVTFPAPGVAGSPSGTSGHQVVVAERSGRGVSGRSVARWAADDALTELYAAHWTSLVRLAWLLVRDQGRAEEIVQDAFVAGHPRMAELREAGNALAYLRRSVVNGCRSTFRHQGVEERYLRAESGAAEALGRRSVESAESEVLRHDEGDTLMDAVRRLPQRQREVLVLRYYGDLSEQQIAEALDISPGAVKSHAHRALATMRSLVRD